MRRIAWQTWVALGCVVLYWASIVALFLGTSR